MAVTWSDVVTFPAPELSTVATGTQNAILAVVDRQIDDDAWGEFANDGRRYLAAHLGTLSSGAGAGAVGPVTSESVGAMSRSYGSLSDTSGAGALGSTRYGLEYYRLLRLALGVPALVP